MNGLFPIIRRKRRPLVVEDVPPIPTSPKPVQSVAATPLVEPAKLVEKPKPTNAKIPSQPESE